MALDKNFLSKRFDPPPLTKKRIVTGIIVGLLYAFSFYGLLYLVREAFRAVSTTYFYDMFVLTVEEHYFFNTIFAFISVIVGQSICFKFWFERRRPIGAKKYYRVLSIINDQTALNWVFLSWFSELGLCFASFFIVGQGSLSIINLHQNYKWLFILIVIVLFLQSWSSLRILLRNKGLKWMLVSAVVVSLISVVFSRINLSDYEKINDSYLSKNLWNKYNIDLPISPVWNKENKPSLVLDVFLVDSIAITYSRFVKDLQVGELNTLGARVKQFKAGMKEYDQPKLKVRLITDQNTKMKHINEYKKMLMRDTALYASFAVAPSEMDYEKEFYKYVSLNMKLPPLFSDSHVTDYFVGAEAFSTYMSINIQKSGIFIDGEKADTAMLKSLLRQIVTKDPNYIVKLYINDDVDYGTYIEVYSAFVSTILDLRDETSYLVYGRSRAELSWEEEKEIKKIIPHRIMDISEEMLRFVNGEQATYYSD